MSRKYRVKNIFFILCGLFFLYDQLCSQHTYDSVKKRMMFAVDKDLSLPYLLFLPLLKDPRNDILVHESYKALDGKLFGKIFLIIQDDDPSFYGIVLPLMWCKQYSFSSLVFDHDAIANLAEHELFFYSDTVFHDHIALHCDYINRYCPCPKVIPMVLGKSSQRTMREIFMCLEYQADENSLFIICADCNALQDEAYEVSCRQSRVVRLYEQDSNVVQAYQEKVIDKKHQKQEYDFVSAHRLLGCFLEFSEKLPFRSYVVGYDVLEDSLNGLLISHLAFIFYRLQGASMGENRISQYEKSMLLSVARQSLFGLYESSIYLEPFLKTKCMVDPIGLFVSLFTMSDHGIILRGCMGRLHSSLSMYDMVVQMSQQAAYDDRYCSLRQKELENTIISITLVLDKITTCLDDEDFIPSHGLMIRYKGKIGIHVPVYDASNSIDSDIKDQLLYQLGIRPEKAKKLPLKVFKFNTIQFQEE